MLCTSPGTCSVVPAGVTVTSWPTRTPVELGQRQVDRDDGGPGAPPRTTPDVVPACLALDQVELTDGATDRCLEHGGVEVLLGRGPCSWVAWSTAILARLADDCPPPP